MKKAAIVVAVLLVVGVLYSVTKSPQKMETNAPTPTVAMTPEKVDKTVDVKGLNYAFDVKEIKVKKGERVQINFTNTEGFHDFKIDEFNVATKQIKAGAMESVVFTADKTGTFEYYCSVGQHRANGMWGKLIVE